MHKTGLFEIAVTLHWNRELWNALEYGRYWKRSRLQLQYATHANLLRRIGLTNDPALVHIDWSFPAFNGDKELRELALA